MALSLPFPRACAAAIVAVLGGPADAVAASFTLRTQMGAFALEPEAMPPMMQRDRVMQAPTATGTGRGLVLAHFDGPIGAVQRDALDDAGIEVHGYYPDDTLLVFLERGDALAALATVPGLAGVVDPPLWLRFEPALLQRRDDGSVNLTTAAAPRALVFEAVSAAAQAALAATVATAGGELVAATPGSTFLQARLDDAQLAVVAAEPTLLHIGVTTPTHTLNDREFGIIQAGAQGAGQSPIWAHGLRGQGRVVGIADIGFRVDGCFFAAAGKVLSVRWANIPTPTGVIAQMEHGTHVAGTVAGNAKGDSIHGVEDGQAPAAALALTAFGKESSATGLFLPDDYEDTIADSLTAGARVQSGSYGGGNNAYDTLSRSIDVTLAKHPDLLAVFANGNEGPGLGTVGYTINAKNVVAVGAFNAQTPQEISSYSSRGPTYDGRFRPHVMLPGTQVASAAWSADCGTVVLSGTSMATPAASAAAALIGQYYAEGFYVAGVSKPGAGAEVSAALVKATLLASTEFMSGQTAKSAIPSPEQGWGRVNLSRALWFQDQGPATLWAVDADPKRALATGDAVSFMLWVKGGELRIVLTWWDPAAMVQAAQAIVNDLDLEVTAPDGRRYRGNIFAPGAQPASTVSAADPQDGLWDRRNTEEVVHLADAAPGGYLVRVMAHAVPGGKQPFALAARGALGDRPDDGTWTAATLAADPEPDPEEAELLAPAGPANLGVLVPPVVSSVLPAAAEYTAPIQSTGGCALAPGPPLAPALAAIAAIRLRRRRRPSGDGR